MRKLISNKLALAAIVLIAASGIAITALTMRGGHPIAASGTAMTAVTLEGHRMASSTASSKDPRTLEEKAKEKAKRGGGDLGHLVANLDFNKGSQQASLAHMVKASESIVIVTTDSNVCRLSEDGKVIRTFYRARVEDVLKGHVKSGGNITVSLPGGKVGFPDGSTAEVQTTWFRKMVNHRRYLLFLTGKPSSDSFTTTGGPQGVFEIAADGGVLSHSGLANDVMRQNAGKSNQAFVKEIKDEIVASKKK